MTCSGCGKLLGLRTEEECTCWLSYSDRAIIPERLRIKTRRIKAMREGRRV